MLKWIRRALDKRAAKLHDERILKRDGCVLYCRNCRSILNGRGDEDHHGIYIAECQCGKVSGFLLDTPVPILVRYT